MAFCHLAQAHTRSCDLNDDKSVQATVPARFHGAPSSEDGAEVFTTAPSSEWKVCGEPQWLVTLTANELRIQLILKTLFQSWNTLMLLIQKATNF